MKKVSKICFTSFQLTLIVKSFEKWVKLITQLARFLIKAILRQLSLFLQ